MLVTKSKFYMIQLVLVLGTLAGVMSVMTPMIALFLAGGIIYVALFSNLSKPIVLKKILTLSIIIMVFQDTIISILNPFNSEFAAILGNLDEFLILFFMPIIFLYNFKRQGMRLSLIEFLLISILILGVASSILNDVPLSISAPGAILMLKGFLIFYIFKSIPFDEKDLIRFRKIFIYIFSIVVIGSIIDLLSPYWFRGILNTENKYDYRGGIISVQSVFVHPGLYGWFMVFVGLYFLAYSYVFKKTSIGLLSTIPFAFAFISFRFKVILSIMGALIYTYLRIGFRRAVLGLVPLCLLVLVVFYFIGDDLQSLIQLTIDRYLNPYYLDSARKALYVVGFMIGTEEIPFGMGWGRFGGWIARINYSPVYYEYGLNNVYGLTPQNPIWATDTYWPYIMGEIGLIGAGLLLTIFIYFIFIIKKGYKIVESREKKLFLFFAVLVIIQSLLESLGEQVFNSAPQYFYIFGVIGIAISIIDNERRVKKGRVNK